MANKRDIARQKRSRENRAQRAALTARTQGAPARPSRVAPSTAEKLKATAGTKSTSAGSKRASSATGHSDALPDDGAKGAKKTRRERPPRPGDRPVDIDTLEGSWVSKVMKVPGGTQVLFAAAMAIVATGLMVFTNMYVADSKDKDANATLTVFEAKSMPVALALVGIPLIITGIAVASSLRPHRRRIWLAAAVILGALALSGVLQLHLIVAGFFGYAVFRAAKVEGQNEPLARALFAGFRRRRGHETSTEVTEPDPVDRS